MQDLERRRIALSLLPLLMYFLSIPALIFAPSRSRFLPMLLAFAAVIGDFVVLIYWSKWVRDDPQIGRIERYAWWLLLWFGNLAGLGFFLYYRIWSGKTLGLGDPEPARISPNPDDVPYDRW